MLEIWNCLNFFFTLFPAALEKVGILLKFLFTMLCNQFDLFVFVRFYSSNYLNENILLVFEMSNGILRDVLYQYNILNQKEGLYSLGCCMPWPSLPAHGGCLGCYIPCLGSMPMGCCLGLGYCMLWPWQHAQGGLALLSLAN